MLPRAIPLCFCSALALLADCAESPPTAEVARTGDAVLRVALETDARGFDPLQTRVMGMATLSVADTLFDTLVRIDRNARVSPGLATSLSVDESGLRWTARLREGVRFHDGEPVDAEAVASHFQRLLDPANACACRPLLGPLQRVYASAPLTVVFELESPWSTLPVALGEPSLISLIGSPAARAEPEVFDRAPVGTGPWRFREWLPDQVIRVVRNEDYWDGEALRGTPGTIEFRVLPDQQARLAALRAGDVDVLWTLDAETAALAERADLAVQKHVGAGARVLVLNTREAPLDDVRVRRALAHAVDAQTWMAATSQGRLAPALDPFGPGSAWSCPSSYPSYDVDAAQALVADYGRPVRFTYAHTPTPRGQTAGQVFQQFWTRAGMQVVLAPTAQGQLVSDVLRRRFQAGPWRLRDSVDPDIDLYGLFHSASPFNMTGVSSPQLDGLLEAMRRESDRERRQQILCHIERQLSDAVPWIFLGPNAYFAVLGEHVRGEAGMQGGFLHVRGLRLAPSSAGR